MSGSGSAVPVDSLVETGAAHLEVHEGTGARGDTNVIRESFAAAGMQNTCKGRQPGTCSGLTWTRVCAGVRHVLVTTHQMIATVIRIVPTGLKSCFVRGTCLSSL